MTPSTTRRSSRLLPALLALALVAAACGDGDGGGDGGAAGGLAGLLRLDEGTCADAGVTAGSWFRMVQSGGTVEDGPFVPNADSPCGDTTWTPLRPGASGGLRLGEHQPFPDPAFDDANHAVADAVIQPQAFFAVNFSAGTNPVDPQTGENVPAPRLEAADDGSLSGDLSSFAAAWNGQHFNQGAPKPSGGRPAGTTGPGGDYDESSGAMTLEWTSLIEGGPFDGFTGVWHLEGDFEAA